MMRYQDTLTTRNPPIHRPAFVAVLFVVAVAVAGASVVVVVVAVALACYFLVVVLALGSLFQGWW